mgnify:CR=1 FL=1
MNSKDLKDPQQAREVLTLIINAAQLVTLLVGFIVAGTYFGKASERLSRNQLDIQELRSITADLAAASVAGHTMDAQHTRTLDELRRRIERLEHSK